MSPILISACLLGHKVRYNGNDAATGHALLAQWQAQWRVVAVLKEGSPSCGSAFTYDGSFSGDHTALPGVTAALLLQNGLKVFNEHQLDEAQAFLQSLDNV